jgi:peptide chain release factor
VEAAIVSTEPSEHEPLSALLSLTGDGAAALCSSWEGTLQWMCPSPLRKGWGRKNWFVAASLLAPPEPSSPLRRGEVRFEPMKASRPGGLHVNKAESAVRATHLPTGPSCVAREERSQHRNKEMALARLAQTIAGRWAQGRCGRPP